MRRLSDGGLRSPCSYYIEYRAGAENLVADALTRFSACNAAYT